MSRTISSLHDFIRGIIIGKKINAYNELVEKFNKIKDLVDGEGETN